MTKPKPYRSQRDPIDRITDRTLITPLKHLTGTEWGMVRRIAADDTGRWEEFAARFPIKAARVD